MNKKIKIVKKESMQNVSSWLAMILLAGIFGYFFHYYQSQPDAKDVARQVRTEQILVDDLKKYSDDVLLTFCTALDEREPFCPVIGSLDNDCKEDLIHCNQVLEGFAKEIQND